MSINDLPDEILAYVFAWVPCLDAVRTLILVSHRWRSVATDERAMGRRPCVVRGSRRSTLCDRAAAAGHVDCLAYARSRGRSWGANVCATAAGGGHLACLEYAHANGCPWDESTPKEAAFGGHLDCLEYARTNGCRWDEDTPEAAAAGGHLDCLAYAYEGGCVTSARACRKAAESGHAACVKYLLDAGFPCTHKTWRAAARGGSVGCLEVLESVCPFLHDPTTWETSMKIGGGGHIAAAEWLRARGVRRGYFMMKGAARHGRADFVDYMLGRGTDARSIGSHNDTAIVWAAARGGHTGCLRLLLEKGQYPFDAERDSMGVYAAAASSGRIECLRYMHEAHGGSAWFSDNRTCATAARKGRLDCLRYAHENGCPWGRRTVSSAAYGGHLDCLIYAIEHGCAYDAYAVEAAARSGKLQCLRYLWTIGVPLTGRALALARKVDTIRFLLDKGCPTDCAYYNNVDHPEAQRLLREAGCRPGRQVPEPSEWDSSSFSSSSSV
ncbi:Ankyrin repeat domain containing protein [Pandoravirus dulcis]|uniref:Ankyrin repeat domain containing protein n=1 Tax=Pandoravirus dulcis TaxID=1349409 RepID=S4VY96_9VIRU|nr:Ankyrin repeat domain containing protein [Pandoravirus dulcis]AGO83021.1 Ankyrin repeat domain containing protein [Pandoravirus dulcis]